MNAPYRRLSGRDEIVAAGSHDPFVSCFVAADAVGFQRDDCLVWNRLWGDTTALMAFGDPDRAAALLLDVMDAERPTRLTVPVEVYDRLPADRRPADPNLWRWFYTREAPSMDGVTPRGEWLGEEWNDAITDLLRLGFPNASNWPGGRPRFGSRRWFGVVEDGTLTACGVAAFNGGDVPSLASICVHPDARGRGLASDMTSWVTADLLADGSPTVALGSYVSEEATHRLYRRLGYRDVQVLASGRFSEN